MFDADIGLANLDVVLGCKVEGTLQHVISGEKSLSEVAAPRSRRDSIHSRRVRGRRPVQPDRASAGSLLCRTDLIGEGHGHPHFRHRCRSRFRT